MDKEVPFADMKLLCSQGYILTQKLGEGNTARVYLAFYTKGDWFENRAVKIPKSREEIEQGDSVQTLINYHKDISEREIKAASFLRHPNIISTLDVFQGEYGNIIISEYLDTKSLSDIVSISEDQIPVKIFCDIGSALLFLHEQRGYVHGDINPSNILVHEVDLEQRVGKLADLQNARLLCSEKSLLPTRGATASTHPELLNALIEGIPSSYEPKHDIYSFCAALYYTITGENPFDYQLVFSPEGRKLKIGSKEHGVALLANGQSISYISLSDHDEEMHEKVESLSDKIHPLTKDILHRGLDVFRTTTSSEIYYLLRNLLLNAGRF